jgi:hypothetical protein
MAKQNHSRTKIMYPNYHFDMKLTQSDIDKIVSQVSGISVEKMLGDSQKQLVTDARNLAMLKGKQHLKLSTIKLYKHYGKRDHTTILSDLKSAQNLIDTNKLARMRELDVEELIRLRKEEIKKANQRKDLHYRIRKKGIIVDVKCKTVSIPQSKLPELNRSMNMIKQLGYEIQYSII